MVPRKGEQEAQRRSGGLAWRAECKARWRSQVTAGAGGAGTTLRSDSDGRGAAQRKPSPNAPSTWPSTRIPSAIEMKVR